MVAPCQQRSECCGGDRGSGGGGGGGDDGGGGGSEGGSGGCKGGNGGGDTKPQQNLSQMALPIVASGFRPFSIGLYEHSRCGK